VSGFKASFDGVARRVMVLMMMADGRLDEEEVETICRVYERLSGQPLTAAEVEAEVVRARGDGRSVTEFLSVLAPVLREQDRASVLRAVYRIAIADGEFAVEEQTLLVEVARALALTPSAVEGIIASTRAEG